MRRPQNRQSFASLFTSKGFVVALCAAIAMILGAMSVGADTTPTQGPTPASPISIANQDGGFVQSEGYQQAQPSNPIKRAPVNYQPPMVIIAKPQANTLSLVTAPVTKTLEIKLKLKPLEATVTVSPQPLLLQVHHEAQDTTSSVKVENTTQTDTSSTILQGEMPETESNSAQAEASDPEPILEESPTE